MRTLEFLRTVWGEGDEGYYCVFAARTADNRRVQKLYRSPESATSAVMRLADDGFDAYFCPATFATGDNRTKENALSSQSLYIDLDCGPSKPYADQQAAVAALRAFCRDSGVPKPSLLVNSGGGLHAYWTLEQALPAEEWRPLAARLHATALAYGLALDESVTRDIVKLLRVPGTWNHKLTTPRPVTILHEGRRYAVATLDAVLVEAVEPPPRTAMTGIDAATQALAGGVDKWFSRIVARSSAGRGCAHIQHALESPEALSYSQWLDVLSVAKFCNDGDTAIHDVSKGYPGYSAEETERVAAAITAPHFCTTFDANAPGRCDGCPKRSVPGFTTPILFGVTYREAAPDEEVEGTPAPISAALFQQPSAPVPTQRYVIPQYPRPFFRGANGGVFLRRTGKDGDPEEIPVYRDDLYIVKRLFDPVQGPTFVFRVHTPRDGVVEFTIAGSKLITRDKFREEFALHGILVYKPEDLMMYVASWINELQQKTDQTLAKTQFGWTSSETLESFVVGNKEYFADRVGDNPPSAPTMQYFPAFVPRGTLEGWKETVDFLNRPGCESQQYMVGLSFGSPLMVLTSIPGAIFHLHSPESGHGKTTAMMAGASVWGSPQSLLMKAKDTTNSQWARAEVMKNLPLWIDELSNIAPKDASDLVYSVTDANQKNRMRNASENLERVRGAPWQMLIGTTGNASLMEKIKSYKQMPDGEAQRIMEHRAREVFHAVADKRATDAFSQGLVNHYGHAGPIFIQRVIKTQDKVRDLYAQLQAHIDIEANLTSSNRIWSAQAACVLTGLTVAKAAGLVSFDLVNLTRWIIQQLKYAKNDVQESRVAAVDLLTQYYAEQFPSVLRIRSTQDRRRTDPATEAMAGLENIVVPDSTPRMQWTMRHEFDVQRLYVMKKPFKDWCAKNQINHGWLIEEAAKPPLNLRKERVRMGKGTRFSTPPMDVYAVEWSDAMEEAASMLIDDHVDGPESALD